MPISETYQPSLAILELGDKFYDRVRPAVFPKAHLRYSNVEAAKTVSLGELSQSEWQNHFHAFKPLPEGLTEPLALRYHGHQFQSYNDRLGDGRGFLFAQLFAQDGRLLDLATKGSGQTPWSRAGDGRLTLKGAVREALATEMLESLGVTTSKTFCFFETGEDLQRNDEPSPTRSAVLTRLGYSHIRFGTFQRQAALKDREALQTLCDYVQRHFYPKAKDPADLLKQIVVKTASLCASWMIAGFVHGVLNTDNMNINGESFDYGPYRFLPTYDPEFTAAYFDQTKLYAYGRQPEAVMWNLEHLASCFYLVHDDRDSLVNALREFTPAFNDAAGAFMYSRLGLVPRPSSKKRSPDEKSPKKSRDLSTDDDLLLAVFILLAQTQITFEQFFFDWYGGALSSDRAKKSPEAAKYKGEAYENFLALISTWPATEEAKHHLQNKYFTAEKPCSLLIDEIEAIWTPIATDDDWTLFNSKIEAIREMGRAHGRR